MTGLQVFSRQTVNLISKKIVTPAVTEEDIEGDEETIREVATKIHKETNKKLMNLHLIFLQLKRGFEEGANEHNN